MLGMVGIDVGIVACLTSYDHFTHLMGEISMANSSNVKKSGYLLMASGVVFFCASFLAAQVALVGPGVALFVIGAANVRRAKKRETDTNAP